MAAGQLHDLIENRHVPSDDPDGRFKVWPTEADQSAFAAVMGAERGDIAEEFSDHLFAQAYGYFAQTVQDWLGSNQGAVAKADALSSALHQQIKLMALDIDPGEDAQVIFETLNARGTPLLPIDLVKNWMLREAKRAKGVDVRRLYQEHWRETFDQNIEYWREQIGRGHAQRARADLFLQNFLTIQLLDEVAADSAADGKYSCSLP